MQYNAIIKMALLNIPSINKRFFLLFVYSLLFVHTARSFLLFILQQFGESKNRYCFWLEQQEMKFLYKKFV